MLSIIGHARNIARAGGNPPVPTGMISVPWLDRPLVVMGEYSNAKVVHAQTRAYAVLQRAVAVAFTCPVNGIESGGKHIPASFAIEIGSWYGTLTAAVLIRNRNIVVTFGPEWSKSRATSVCMESVVLPNLN